MKNYLPYLLWISVLLTGCWNQNNTQDINLNVDLQKSEICNNSKWILTNRAEWWDITVCAYDDGSFCFLEDIESWLCEKGLIFFEDTNEINEEIDNNEMSNNNDSESSECDQLEQNIVCGKDWNTYQNRCYLNEAGVEEETETAQVENWVCIFG